MCVLYLVYNNVFCEVVLILLCLDINECKENIYDCYKIWVNCIDLMFFWKCVCKEGYSGDGKECEGG